MTSGPILCCGCGKEAVGGVKPCNCATMCGWRKGEPGSVLLISRGQDRRNQLANLIESKLIGVDPEDQDIVLEDGDWREIVTALEGKAALENGPAVLADAHSKSPSSERIEVLEEALRPFAKAGNELPDDRIMSEAHPEWQRCLRRFKAKADALTVRHFRRARSALAREGGA